MKLDTLINVIIISTSIYYYNVGVVGDNAQIDIHSLSILFLFLCAFVDFANANLPWQFKESRFVKAKLKSKDALKDLKKVRRFAAKHPKLSKTTSTHWWYVHKYIYIHIYHHLSLSLNINQHEIL